MRTCSLKIRNLTKRFRSIYREVTALKDINLEVEEGEFFVILGPSGCGKSTFLNILAGLEKPDKGKVWFGNRLVVSVEDGLFLSPRERNVAMVFQSYALYPHMNVFENIAFPLRVAGLPGEEIEVRVNRVAGMLDIAELLHSRPRELSGGQRQRVAIARALVRNPSVFLLDEPLSNLDAQLRQKMRAELKALQRELRVTTLYVTHDQVEAMTLGDRIAILKDGEVQQVGNPLEIYHNPSNIFVAGFIGTPPMNLLKARAIMEHGSCFLKIGDIKIKIKAEVVKGKEIIMGIRPEDIEVVKEPVTGSFEVRITLVEHLGTESILHTNIGKNRLLIKLKEDVDYREGDRVRILIRPEKIHLFDENGKSLR